MRKKYVIAGIVCSILICCLSGCSLKEDDKNTESRTNAAETESQELSTQMIQSEKVTDIQSEEETDTQSVNEMDTQSTNETDTPPETVTADYGELFQTKSGCAVMFDTAKNTYTFYNEEICRIQTSPCSTFKIISTLAGLHNGVITSEDSRLGYSGVTYSREAWNQDVNLADAFKSSCVWYFRKIIDGAGPEKMQNELDALNYGNCDSSEWEGSGCNPLPELNGFWINSSLKISPLEQVEVLRNIMEGNSIYTEEETAILKTVMLADTDGSRNIYGKTGSGTDNTAWFVGFAEENENRLYFAVYLDESNTEKISGTNAKEIAFNILKDYD